MKILRTASLGSNFTGSYYNKKEWQLARQLVSQLGRYQVYSQLASCPVPLRPGQQLLIKLASYREKAKKNYYHYCLLVRPNFFSVFNNMLSYLSFLKQLQFLAEQSPSQPLRRFTSLISIFCVDVTTGCFFGYTFISHHTQHISSLRLSWFFLLVFHGISTDFLRRRRAFLMT